MELRRSLDLGREDHNALVQKLVDIVYDASDNQAVAKGLVDKILRRL